MPEYPLLLLPSPTTPHRSSLPSKMIPAPHIPTSTRQIERLSPRFSELERLASSEELKIVPSPTGYEPEQVLVLETVGTVQEFQAAVTKIAGLEWMGDADLGDIVSDDDFYIEDDTETPLNGRLFLIMFNQQGLEQLLSLWQQYRNAPDGSQFEKGRKKWASLFAQIRNIRRWGIQDRIESTGLRNSLEELKAIGRDNIEVELELWFKTSVDRRGSSMAQLREIISSEAGTLIAESVLPEIRYHGALARVPLSAVERMFEAEGTRLVRFEQLMFIRPTGQVMAYETVTEPEHIEDTKLGEDLTKELPVLALLDGFPLQHHAELEGRIIIDDPDSWEDDCEVKNRVHGTAMASIVLRGDMNKPDHPPVRPIYIRPILKPEEWPDGQVHDNVPRDVLTLDLVHRAFRRMFEPEGDEKPAAPTVRIVVLAVCDRALVEQRFPSPFARLLDYLSYKYNVLVLIACGNQASNLPVKSADIDSGDPEVIARGFTKAVNDNAPFRRILSPGESLNGLTIGATHADSSNPLLFSGIIDPYLGHSMPSPVNSQGPGFRRVIKPEVLVPGGRQLYRKPLTSIAGNTSYPMEIVQSQLAPGIKVASPSPTPGVVTGTRHIRGTSASTAYVGHLASICYETILELQHSEGSTHLDDQYVPVLIKAMLAHGAKWGTLASEIEGLLGTQSKAALMRLLGYGEIETDSLYECTAQRAIMLGWGVLLPDQAHLYRVPLPLSLNGVAGWRRVTITLAAIGAMNSANHKYRKTQVWFDVLDPDGYCTALAVNRKEADWQAVRRGMLQHEVLDGNHASVFGEQGVAQIQVNCRTDAGGRQDLVRYGLVVSLEVAPETNLPIYQEIRNRIAQPIVVTPDIS